MTRIAIIADSHFDEHGRFEECVRLHAWMAADMRERGVTLVLHGGDVYERRSTPPERNAVAAWVREVASFAPVVIVRGNHDALGDLRILGGLESLCGITVEEGAGVHAVEDADGAPVAVACLAWPQKAGLLASAASAEGAAQDAAQALRNVLLGLGAELQRTADAPRVLLAHAMVRGSVTSTGQPLVGCDLELGLEDLALARAHLYALGHIHKGQAWDIAGAPAVYPGSPRRTTFGESEAKGYQLATFDGAMLASLEFVEAPATPMVDVTTDWTAFGFTGVRPDVSGAEVRLRYAVDSDRRDAARDGAAALEAELLAGGAASVKIEEIVRATTRARAPEVAAAPTLVEKLDALWRAKGVTLDPIRRDAVLAKLSSVEAA